MTPRVLAVHLLAVTLPPLQADVIISEFLADNENGERDDFGEREDWIEIYNNGDEAADLDGWFLTDDAAQPTHWAFPPMQLAAGQTLVVWASGRDRRDPAGALHTNFRLSKSGEFLGLFRLGEGSGEAEGVSVFSPAFPVQVSDVSYGFPIGGSTVTAIDTGELARFTVVPDSGAGAARWAGTDYASGDLGHGQAGGWNVSPSFGDATWSAGATGIGYDTSGGLEVWVGTSPSGNCEAALRNVNTSIQIRQTFEVTDPGAFATATLRMRYEDGFVAFVNGTEVGRANFSGPLAFDSRSDGALDETIVDGWTDFDVPMSLLEDGTNLLAIQGLNSSPGSSDFLIVPELELRTAGEIGEASYFGTPTPGTINGTGSAGPVLHSALPADPDVPRPAGNGSSPPLVVSVSVIPTARPVASVTAYHRTMWDAEVAVALNDSGTGGDAVAGDGIYSGSLPTGLVGAGRMFRWRFEALDDQGNASEWPAFSDPLDSSRYFGTVAWNGSTSTSELPVLEWFVEGSPTTGPTAGEFRGACYFLGRFYDNIGHEIHGQSTSNFAKKSYDFDSNGDARFVWREGERKVKDLNLLSNWADKTKARNTIAHEIGEMAGTVSHFAYPVRVELNGAFHGVMDLVEDGDDRMLERNGLDGEGALYKIYRENFLSSAQKKTRKDEGTQDLQELAAALDESRPIAERLAWAHDNIDLAATINYMVVRQINSDEDHGHKNFYLYRDTEGTREWRPLVWDVDLCFGHNWISGPGYFDDTLYSNNPLNSHSDNNRLYNLVLDTPELRKMWTRRMRTLMDGILQPPGTSNGLIETRLREIAASIDPDPANPSPSTDGDRDAAKWGFSNRFIPNRPREEVERVISGYLVPRRNFLFNTSAGRPLLNRFGVAGGEPIPDAPQVSVAGMVTIDGLDFNPVSGRQAEEYVMLRNVTGDAVDLSGWTLSGAVDHRFEGGTVIPPGDGSAASSYAGLLHVAKDALAFRSRSTGPTGGQRRLVQGNYSGQLSARGEVVELRDASGLLIDSYGYAGSETVLQAALRVSEIQYHPAGPDALETETLPGVGESDFEFIELTNIGTATIDLEGAAFVEGIDFVFGPVSLEPGSHVVVARNPDAFALRHPGSEAVVLGPYLGFLDNAGERLQLTDAVGEVVLDFEYKDGWYPATDGSGRSLVVRNAEVPPGEFGDPVSWAISAGPSGSPGAGDDGFAQAYSGWDNFHFTSVERDDPAISGPEADADGDGRLNWEEYALGTDPRVADLPDFRFGWVGAGVDERPGIGFVRPSDAIDISYHLQRSLLLEDGFADVPASESDVLPLGDGRESLFLADDEPTGGPAAFYRLRLGFAP